MKECILFEFLWELASLSHLTFGLLKFSDFGRIVSVRKNLIPEILAVLLSSVFAEHWKNMSFLGSHFQFY